MSVTVSRCTFLVDPGMNAAALRVLGATDWAVSPAELYARIAGSGAEPYRWDGSYPLILTDDPELAGLIVPCGHRLRVVEGWLVRPDVDLRRLCPRCREGLPPDEPAFELWLHDDEVPL